MADQTLPHGDPLPPETKPRHDGPAENGRPASLKPGALTAILRELAAAPEAPESEPPSVQPGTIVGRFELVRELGRGAFGVAYEARDRELGRSVALKIVRPGKAKVGEAQLVREAEAVARLSHPNLVTLFDVGRSEVGPYLVFELLRGETLQSRLDRGPLSPAEAVRVGVEVARGLAHAHAEGVIHRDLKPSNVFLCERGVAKILDFGMAHAFGRRRASGGTPAYMAPEQWEENPEDERTDVFALGVMLHEMLSGELPFPKDAGKWSSGAAEAPRLDLPGAPDLGPLVARMLERVPKERPRDGAEVLAALERITASLPPEPAGAPAPRAVRRRSGFVELVAELKRRRVFRVMVGYGVFSFAVLQVIEPIMHGAHLGDWVLTAALVALAIGFPVAVILSWLFDLTASGVQRTPSAAGTRAITLSRGRIAALLVGVGLLAALPGVAWYAWKWAGRPAAEPPAAISSASIAVLPFADLSPSHDQDYFSDGVAEEILTALSRVEGLRVPGQASSFWFKGKNAEPAEIGQRLGVTHLLQGSVRRSATRLRIKAEVTRIAGGERLWEQTFEREQGDVFAIQDEIARAVVEALKGKLLPGQQRMALAESPSTSPEAYSQYLLGRQLFHLGSPEGYRRAVEAYEQAIAIDSRYAPAWAGLALAANYASNYAATGDRAQTLIGRSLEAGDMAVELAPSLPEALAARGYCRALVRYDWAGARADLGRAMELDARNAEIHRLFASFVLGPQRLVAEGIESARRATELDPASSLAWNSLGVLYLEASHWVRAEEALHEALRLSPDQSFAAMNLTKVLVKEGRVAEALAIAERALAPGRKLTSVALAEAAQGHEAESRRALEALEQGYGAQTPFQIAMVHAARGERGAALDWLERAYELRDRELPINIWVDPWIRELSGEPRYQAVLTKLNLAPGPIARATGGTGATAGPPSHLSPSIAVLPFADMSEKHDQGYFADGVAEEILNALAHLDGLKVIGRTSSFSFKGKADDLRAIGQKLDVATILEGSLRKDGDQVRVTAQLIRVADGSHLWSASYDRKLAGIFKVQDEIARAVVAALKVRLLSGAPATPPLQPSTTPEAYRLYLLGREQSARDTVSGSEEAIRALSSAVSLDPAYAPAQAWLAFALYAKAQLDNGDTPAANAAALAQIERAVALAPDRADGYAVRALLNQFVNLKWSEAQRDADHALKLAPGDVMAQTIRARLLATLGRLPEALQVARRALEADPLSVQTIRTVGDLQAASGDLGAAERTFRRGLELEPTHARLLRGLGFTLLQAGRYQEALALFERHPVPWMRSLGLALAHHSLGHDVESRSALEALIAYGATNGYQLAEAYAWRGELDPAFTWLARAVETRDSGLPYLKFDPLLAKLHADPRWRPLLRRLNLPVD